ncbi:MAG: transglycosylase domain-containing protein [Acidimicrobiales bacterium]|nr:transglycosylase domain-containing protein [Acidimicrobiales bacterium]
MRERLERWGHWWAALPRSVRWLSYAMAGLGTALVVLLIGLWFTLDLPDDTPEPESAVLLSADGQELAVLSEEGRRVNVTLDQVAPVMRHAVVAAEDRRFYGHGGVDPIGIARAAWRNTIGDGTQGGSTITQQLIKNVSSGGERSLWNKLEEAVLAMKLEQTADKDRILERYLNAVYFGRGVYGVEAAAQVYFGVPASELTLSQAALLAGLLRSPETADPAEDPEEASRRRQTVLDALVAAGDATEEEAAGAATEPMAVLPEVDAVRLVAGLAPHFVDWVTAEAVAAVGEAAVYRDGLRIVTTLDLDAQRAAEESVAKVLPDPGDPQAALVALDTDGAVRAHVGSRSYEELQVDVVRGLDGGGSGRQPGSAFKPFVLQAALSRGVHLRDPYAGPAHLELDVGGAPWSVDNYGNEDFGRVDLLQATARSVNTVYAQLLAETGPQAVVEAARAAGIGSELTPEAGIALGTEEVSPLELAQAYLTFANDGNSVLPYRIARIETPEGAVVWEPERPEPERAVDEGVARAVTFALRGVIESGTGQGADIGRPAAGKTGTTQENVDAWFAGYVPGYATVVWMGYGDPAPMTDVHGRSVTGGSFPADIWREFMRTAVADRPPDDFPAPPDDLVQGEPVTLTAEPSPLRPGDVLTVRGSGFDRCVASWSVTVDGTAIASQAETDADSTERSASLQLPSDLAPGDYEAVAQCDVGAGPEAAARARFTVQEPTTTTAPTTTAIAPSTTTVPPTTTPTTRPPRATTTTPAPTTTDPAVTTTTRTPGRGGG